MSDLVWMLCLLLVYICKADGACEFPSDLRGEWYTTSNGLVTFNNQSVTNFKSSIHSSAQTFNCEYTDNGRYITRARIPILSTSLYDVYFCMSFTKITETKYLVQYNADIAGFVKERVVGRTVLASSTTLLPAAEACNVTTAIPTGSHELYVKKGYEASNTITCPDSVVSTLDMTLNSDCTGNVLYGMSYPTYLIHSYNTSCITTEKTFTTSGNLSCMYYVVSGSATFLTVYNQDSTTDETTTYRFLCYSITSNSDQVHLTYHPKICQHNQTSTYVTSPGVVAYLVDRYKDAAPSDDSILVAVLVGTLVPLLLLLGMIFVLVYWKIKIRQRINHELELTARRNWKKLAQNFTVASKHKMETVEEYANHAKLVKKKKKKKKERDQTDENISVISHTDSRRRSVWWDDFSNSIEEHQEPPVWQKRWEMFNDPLNKEVVDDGRRSPGTARSVTSVRNIWMKPESHEQAEVDSVWEKVAVQLTNLRKPAKPGENQQHR
ncbi:uncharacterized protein LOC125680066 [Ostrea edulis]|uniref:uncharacterized protein LOC125680066 n=1 Tax=Ostrea edulis TaxID=37623 RepID=UPI0024AF2D77|nr:uncharacterized protein LOC125680066 [Ostrea edulis]